MWRVLIFLIFFGDMASAGPWPRGKGAFFYSFASIYQTGDRNKAGDYISGYGEYGLTDRFTLGADLGSDGSRPTKYIGFLSYSLGLPETKWKTAVELGLGQINGSTTLRPGLSVGRSFSLADRSGWMSVDTRWSLAHATRLEADFTIGISALKRHKLIMQFQTGDPAHKPPYLRLAPSWVYQLKPNRHIELGLTAGLIKSHDLGLKIGFWRSR